MKVQIEAQGLDKVLSAMESMTSRGVRLQPLMRKVGVVLVGSVFSSFEAQGRPNRWKPWSPLTEEIYSGQAEAQAMSTQRYKSAKRQSTRFKLRDAAVDRRIGQGSKILMNTGDLRKSIMVGEVTNESVEIGSSLVYARIHQLGGTILPKNAKMLRAGGYFPLKRVTIPARPYLTVQPEDVPVISRLTIDFIRGE